MENRTWFHGKVRRNLVDMHIEDWDPAFLAQLDPAAYVENLKRARVQAAMIYAHSQRRVLPVADKMRQPKPAAGVPGPGDVSGGRYGVCCPNSPGYRRYTVAQIEEFCGRFAFEGVFFDMTFWPSLCYCPSCRARYAKEVGGEMPTVVDWSDPRWVAFQRKREEWLLEFGRLATETVRRCKPDASVNHQFSTAQACWLQGVTERHREISDYLGGDFYEDFGHQIFFCKLFSNISPSLPYEFHTSRCTNLVDHTTTKPREELALMNALTLAHRGATLFIDAIDPAGTLNPGVYETFGAVFTASSRCEPFVGGEALEDVAVYYSLDSKYDPADDGRRVTEELSRAVPHLQTAKRAARTLGESHIPYGVISASCLDRLDRHRVLVLPEVLALSDEEAAAIRGWVRAGGKLYASGTAVCRVLGDVLGVHSDGEIDERVSYLAPTTMGESLMPGVSRRYPLMVSRRQAKARAQRGGEVAATITLPYTDPEDSSRFASIHSHPPGRPTDLPSVVVRRHGEGTTIWTAAPIEAYPQSVHRGVFRAMINRLATGSWSFEVSAPPVVEALVHRQEADRRFLVSLVNVQETLPAVPVRGIEVRIALGGRRLRRIRLLPDDREIPGTTRGDAAVFEAPELTTLTMIAVEYD